MPGGIHPSVSQLLQWPVPNYIDPPTQPKYVLIFSCIIGPISIALLFARLWVRMRIQRNVGWDDWLMLASLFPTITLTIIFPLITEAYRFNRHVWDVEFKYFPLQRHYVMAIYSLFTLASGLIKMSVLLFYRRLSSHAVAPTFHWLLRITWVAVGIYTIAFVFIPLFACHPLTAFWNQVDITRIASGYQYTCINEGVDVVANGVASTVQDFIVAFLPTLLCWNLHLPIRQKIALYGIFAVSYTTVAVGAMRTYTGYRIFFQTYDITWVASDTWLWSLMELHIGSMCANAPALRAFFIQFLKSERVSPWMRSRFKPRSAGSKVKRSTDTNTTSPSTASRSTLREKMSLWKKSLNSRDTSGSLSKHHTHIFTDRNGGVLQMNAHFDSHDLQRDSMSKPFAPEYVDTLVHQSRHQSYDHDIEMGNLSLRPSLDGSEVLALPPITPLEPARCRSALPFSIRQGVFWDTRVRKYVWKPWDKKTRGINLWQGE